MYVHCINIHWSRENDLCSLLKSLKCVFPSIIKIYKTLKIEVKYCYKGWTGLSRSKLNHFNNRSIVKRLQVV
jgi:hypothetical protein